MNPLSPPLKLLLFTPPWQCVDKVNIIFLNTQNLAKVVLCCVIIKLSTWGSYCRWGKPFYSRLCFMEELRNKYLYLWTENKCQNPVCLYEEWNLDHFFCHYLEIEFFSYSTRSFIMIFKGKKNTTKNSPPIPSHILCLFFLLLPYRHDSVGFFMEPDQSPEQIVGLDLNSGMNKIPQ